MHSIDECVDESQLSLVLYTLVNKTTSYAHGQTQGPCSLRSCTGVKYLNFKIILETSIYLSKIVKCMCILCKFTWLKIAYKQSETKPSWMCLSLEAR